MRALTLWVALVFGCINTVRAFDFDATFPVTGYSGNLIWNYPGSNTDMYLAPDYNTAQYHTLYNAQSFVPTAFGDATTVTSAPVADYSQFTVALRGAGTYGFSVLEPGTVAGQSPTNYDLMSILYVSPTSRTPFDPNQPYANLVGLSDDDHLHSANPYTLFYINEDATACVTMTLVYFSWAGVQNSVANIRASGPGTIASNCDALGIIDATTAQGNLPARGAANVIEASPALLDLFSGLSTDQERSNAVSQTLPLLTGGSMVATTSGLTGINRVIQARIEGNRGLSAGESFYGDRHMWVKPFGSWARQDDRDAVPGFKANTTGLALGIDGTVSERWRLGGAFAYARGDINGNSVVAPQSAIVDLYVLIGYGSYSIDDRTDLNFQVDVGQNKNAGTRGIGFTSSAASSSYDSYTAHLGVGLGRTYSMTPKTNFTPSIRADYTVIKDEAYSETGAGSLNLSVDSRKFDQLILGTDARFTHYLSDRWTASANVGVGYDTMNSQAAITATFAGAPGASFVTYGLDQSPWLGRGGCGVTYKIKTSVELTGRYDAEVREGFTNQTASVKLRWLI